MMKDKIAYVVCLSCMSSFAIPEEFIPVNFPCIECKTGKYIQLFAS